MAISGVGELQERIVVGRLIWLTMLLGCLVVLSASTPAFAQVDGAGGGAAEAGSNYFEFFVVKGGVVAYFIIVLSVVALALAIEHCISIRRATIVPPVAVEQLRALLDEKRYVDALQYAAEEPSMVGHVVRAALLEAPNGFAAMERALDESIEERSAKLFRKIEFLNIIGAVSPMLGLFGTVVGMILLFSAIHAADTFPRAQVVADRVSIALVATFWGLAVAIPSLSVYAVFRNRIEVLTAECALAVERILMVLRGGDSTAPGQPEPGPSVAEVANR